MDPWYKCHLDTRIESCQGATKSSGGASAHSTDSRKKEIHKGWH